MNKPLLSVIIISHNQRDELIRCVDSVLAQDIPFEYEIILSDDRSTDGTFEVANEYASKYPFIIATQCNSNECNPINTSERSGWNRCNGYKYAKGKYIVHIDGDDYFKGTDCLRLQVELLEQYSECSMCMQNIWCIEAGTPELHGSSWHALHKYHTGQIVTAKDFFLNQMYLLNQAFVMRRNDQIDPVKLYGKYYVDDIITFHHLQFGSIVCLDRCDYVYVINPKSIIRSYSNQVERDLILTLDLTVFASHFVPMFTELYYACYKKDLLRIVNLILSGGRVKERKKTLEQYNTFITKVCVSEKISILGISRLQLIRILLIFAVHLKKYHEFIYRCIHKLFVYTK